MTLFAPVYFVFAFFCALTAFLVLLRRSKSAVNVGFSLLSIVFGVYFISFANMFISHDAQKALMWSKIAFAAISFSAILLLRFIYAYTNTIASKKFYAFFYLLSAAAAVLCFYTDFFYKGVLPNYFGYYPQAFPLCLLIPAQLIAFLFLSLKKLKEYLRKPDLTAFRHQQILKIRNALLILFVLAADQILFVFDAPVLHLGAFSIIIFCAITVWTLGRYTFTDVKILLTRFFIFLFIVGAAISASYAAWKFSGVWFASASVTFVLAVAGAYAYRAAVNKTADLFLAEQKKYHNTLIQAASGMASEHELDRLLKIMSILLIRTVKVKNTAVFVGNESGKLYECLHMRPASGEMIFPYSSAHPFVVFMKNKGGPFVTADMPLYITNSIELPFKPSFIVPFFFDSGAKGFIVFGPKTDGKSFNRKDLEVFQTLARQTSLAIENCLFFDEFKHTQEKIFAAEKLASVGGLADGIAHQINNRLNQFSMIAAELKFEIEDFKKDNSALLNGSQKLNKSFSYITELSAALEENIKRTDAVIKGILNYARSDKSVGKSEFPLKEVFDLAMELLKLKHKLHKGFELELNFKDGDKIYGIRSQIIESVYNVLDNAYEAAIDKMESLKDEEKRKYVPHITVDLKYADEKAVFSIKDNGIGIKEENKVKIFAPFFTTKSSYKSGTGIGLYIVKRMIEENNGGRLSFESKYGQGTKIIFELPMGKGK
jgi:signal transduction histidine kinase